MCWNIGSTHSDGRVRVEVFNKILEPSYYVSAKNRQIIHERLDSIGYNWISVSKLTQGVYFDKFKKYFVRRQSDGIKYKGWLDYVRRKYSELVSNARSDWEKYDKRDNRVGMEVYLSWVEFWKSMPFQQSPKFRKTIAGGWPPSTHTSGSTSHRTVAARMKMQYKCEPTADQLFKETHTRHVKKKKNLTGEEGENGEDGEDTEVIWIDKKSQQISCIILQ